MFRIPHVKRAAWVAMVAALAGLVVSIGYLSIRIGQQSTREEAQPADVILVLGAAEYRGGPRKYFARASTTRWNCTTASWRLRS